MRLERTVEIDSPPEVVWAVYSDVERWPEWTPSVISVERLDAGPLGAGSRARIRQPGVPAAVWRVTSFEPGRFWAWEAAAPGYRMVGEHRVRPRPEGGAEAPMAVEAWGLLARLLWWRIRGVSERYLAMEAAGLKRRCEAGAPGAG